MRMKPLILPFALLATAIPNFAAMTPKVAPLKTETLVVAGGCFWCVEAIFRDLKGVSAVESGYAGGWVKRPTYEQVCTGQTGHAEAVKITFDPAVVSGDDLLRIFFTTHDPTTLNQQGPDYGTQYRSAIFVTNEDEKKRAQKIIAEVTKEKLYRNKIVTTIEPLVNYTKAEDYHQDYFAKYQQSSPFERQKMNAGYCANIIAPKVAKFRAKYADKLKKN
jgi:peptide-methionine (S)-S-oxide reductase